MDIYYAVVYRKGAGPWRVYRTGPSEEAVERYFDRLFRDSTVTHLGVLRMYRNTDRFEVVKMKGEHSRISTAVFERSRTKLDLD